MHKLSILALNSFVVIDLAIAFDVFGRSFSSSGEKLYDVCVCSNINVIDCGSFTLRTKYNLNALLEANTIIIPGVVDIDNPADNAVLNALRQAATKGVRIASICSGAFVLAKAGLLDGLKATTHWRAAKELATRYPKITVEPDVLFIDNGNILTSAGVTSGVDLCLHMIRKDYGAEAAEAAAADLVMPPERSGHQAQRIKHEAPHSGISMNDILFWLQENLGRKFSVENTAKRFNMSERTLNRRFREQAGTTPLQWILGARVKRAQQLLETTALSIEGIADATGFESTASFRDRFRRLVGTTPTAWRNTYKK